MKELYISVDIEADGPIPGPNSMLSLGAAAFLETGEMVDTFSVNFETLPDASGDPGTMRWWATQAEAWKAHRVDPKSPEEATGLFHCWVEYASNGYKPVFVGAPAGFDFTFVYWYLMKFCRHSPFSFSAIDTKTYAMAMLGTNYRQSTKKNYPRHWFDGQPKHNHVALTDAIGQGMLFIKMLQENKKGRNR